MGCCTVTGSMWERFEEGRRKIIRVSATTEEVIYQEPFQGPGMNPKEMQILELIRQGEGIATEGF